MHLGPTVAKIKVGQVQRRHAVYMYVEIRSLALYKLIKKIGIKRIHLRLTVLGNFRSRA